jgi:hypothetical protein
MPGEWHNKMENMFPENMREVKFFCSTKETNTCRRADIMLNNQRTLEIQHSAISENEIINRFNDWNRFGKNIIWLVDGNTEDVKCEKLTNGSFLVIFNKSWKYKSFKKTYKNILLEINGNVFKIELQNVKCKMILLSKPLSLDVVIENLKSRSNEIWSLWDETNVIKPTLKVYQQGAGNGKTFGIWKNISNNEDKETYVIVTKQHSAKNVIYEELIDQTNRKEYHIENLTDKIEHNLHKHYCIKYTHKQSNRKCVVLIGTIDSYCYNLSGCNNNSQNFFQGILSNINKYGPTKVSQYGHMNFAGQHIFINKKCEIWIDEVQDLPISYLYAFTRLMLETNCDVNVVGDKVQSLEYAQNFLTEIKNEKLPNINIHFEMEKNVNRRIKVKNMHNKINQIIDFEKYGVQPISINDESTLLETNDEPIEIIDSPIIYAKDKDEIKISNFIDLLISNVDIQVKSHFYTPNNFIFVFPIMKSNILAIELQTKLQEYWLNKFNDIEYTSNIKDTYWMNHKPNKYIQYVHLHKHTEGVVINTKDSIHTTRIMSIRTSKGDGREVVFILGTTEKSLKLVSDNEIGLVYESHLHVAFTRAKNKIYFGLIKNNDNIHSRFSEFDEVGFLPKIKKSLQIEELIENYIDKEKIKNILIDNDVSADKYINDSSNNRVVIKEQVDWGYHCIKYTAYLYSVIFNVFKNKNNSKNFKQSQLYVILQKISKLKITMKSAKDYWYYLKDKQYKTDSEQMKELPICVLNKQYNWVQYINKIKETMCKIQRKIKKNEIVKMNAYESVVLVYMIDIFSNQLYADIVTPMELYNITHFFYGTNDTKEKKLLLQLNNINNMVKTALNNTQSNTKWNMFKYIKLNSKDDIAVKKLKYPIIGHSDNKVTHIMLKSSINKLNFWDTIVECIIERFLIFNPQGDKDNDKYKDKDIESIIFILDEGRYIKIDWNWDKELYNNIIEEVKSSIQKYYECYHNDIYKYLNQIRSLHNKGKYWGKGTVCRTPFEYIYTKMKNYHYPSYIIKLFQEFDTKWSNGDKQVVKNSYETYDSLNEILKSKLNNVLDSNFFKIITEDVDEDF